MSTGQLELIIKNVNMIIKKSTCIVVIVLLLCTSCRVAKKDWVKENFTEIATTQKIRAVQNDSVDKRINQLSKTVTSQLESFKENASRTKSLNETQSTNVEGSIIAEDGKEKSVTVGTTTIKSNGANVTFSTNTSKSLNSEYKETFEALSRQLKTEQDYRELIQNEVNSLKTQSSAIKKQLQQLTDARSKSVVKRGFSFGAWLWFLIIALIVVAYFILRKKLPFLP
jgi:hypothetical protein